MTGRQRPDDCGRTRAQPNADRNLVVNLHIEAAILSAAFQSPAYGADHQVVLVQSDALRVHALITNGYGPIRPGGDMQVQVEAQCQGRAIKGATQVGTRCGNTHGNPLGHRHSLQFSVTFWNWGEVACQSSTSTRKGNSDSSKASLRCRSVSSLSLPDATTTRSR